MQKLAFDDPINKTLNPQMRDSLARRISSEIDAWCVQKYTDEHRTHLGASVIGDDCLRKIWFSFRWCKTEIFDGRQLRLFNRGHLEEKRWIEWLRGINFTVWEVDPQTQKQFKIWAAHGHYGGSNDGVGQTPYPELIGLNLLLEFKSHNAGSFKQLKDKGMIISKPQHYAQMCNYGRAFGLKYGMYCASGKNDDDHHIEIVELNWDHADDMTRKAEDIIFSPVPPPKIAMQSTHFECKYCPHKGPCHFNEPVEINCRSCRQAVPIENAQWACRLHNVILEPEFIKHGCRDHISIL